MLVLPVIEYVLHGIPANTNNTRDSDTPDLQFSRIRVTDGHDRMSAAMFAIAAAE